MQFTVWLTYDCNLQCKYCYEGAEKMMDQMNYKIADKVLHFIYNRISYKHGKDEFDSIVFHGGEPLLNYEVMRYMIGKVKGWKKQFPIYLSTTTNAILLDNEKIKYLLYNLDELSVSLDGIKEAHNVNRCFANGKGSFDLIIENVKKLIACADTNCGLRIRMTITPNTVHFFYKSIEYLVELGFVNITPVLDEFSIWSDADIEYLYGEIIKVYENFYIKDDRLFIGLIDNILMRQISHCLAGEKTMHISPVGEIYPCAYVMGKEKFMLGDVEKGLQEEKIYELKRINNESLKTCLSCSWKELCVANRCRMLNYAITGDCCQPARATCMSEHLLLRVHGHVNRL